MKRITILGVTGSIGRQCIDIVEHNPQDFEIIAITAGRNILVLEDILKRIKVNYVWVMEERDILQLAKRYPNITFLSGEDNLIKLASLAENDIVLNAIVGFAGLRPTIAAIENGKDIALANKETLVAAGEIIMDLVKKHGVKLLPVDSEHSAIFQSLQGKVVSKIKRIILTASGGAFRDKAREELVDVTLEDALKHPNWAMGAKITVDSATMFNKGLEIIEAKWLFDVSYDQIEVVIHPESILHSAVEFEDNAIIGQMGLPDMRLPIQYALTYPERKKIAGSQSLNITELASLHFYKPDLNRFQALDLALAAGKRGGTLPCVMNGANEEANRLFREGKIKFLDIEELVKFVMKKHKVIDSPSIDQLFEADAWAREEVNREAQCKQL